jgi:phospholipase/carboxylesterase
MRRRKFAPAQLSQMPGNCFFANCTRRYVLSLGMGFVISIAVPPLSSCAKQALPPMKTLKQTSSTAAGRLQARPKVPSEAGASGLYPLGLDGKRDGLLYVPATYQADQSLPLILMLHGAGGDAEGGLKLIQNLANRFKTIVLAVDSRQQTWDVIINRYGADITFIDQALTQTFNRYEIDPKRVAIAGFSDGASYALSVGITNGDLFTHAIAFSPGFIAPVDQIGQPQLFISHGTDDRVLPIDRCSRRIVPQLQRAGYYLRYEEFNGGHSVPKEIAQAAFEWFTNG